MTAPISQVLPFNPDAQVVSDPKADASIIFTPTDGGVSAQRDPNAPLPTTPKTVWEEAGFKTAEEMGKAYSELRTKMSKEGAPKPEEPKAPEPEAKDEAAAKLAADAAAAEAKEAAIVKTTSEAFAAETRGQEEIDATLKWAQENLSPANQKAYNDAIDSGDEKTIKHAVKTLVSTYRQMTKAHEPKLETRLTPAPATVVEGYADTAAMLRDMNNPIYQQSEAFRAQVAAKIKASKNI